MGVSFDTVEDNKKFAEKFNFPFKLLSDTSRQMGIAYHAASAADAQWAKRIAYLIDRGQIAKVYDVKQPAQHAEQVLNDARALG